jgi:hypothetical protein
MRRLCGMYRRKRRVAEFLFYLGGDEIGDDGRKDDRRYLRRFGAVKEVLRQKAGHERTHERGPAPAADRAGQKKSRTEFPRSRPAAIPGI